MTYVVRSSKYTREVLEPLVKSSRSLAEVMRKLGLRTTGGNHRYISLRIRNAQLDTSHFKGRIAAQSEAIPEQELAELVRDCSSVAQVLLKLGLPENGRPHHEMKARILSLGLDTAHFTGPGWSRGKSWRTNESLARGREKRRLLDDVFVENSRMYHGSSLTPHLLALGWTYACAWCGISDWRGKPLVLHLDHANGIHNDNRLVNLRFLCPNCHSQTETYSNRRPD